MSNTVVRSFSAGELAPSLYARTDLARYEIGLRTCRNFVVMRQGGATRRPGTEFVVSTKDSTKRARLFPFVFSVDQAFVLEFGDFYIRFAQNAGQVLNEAGDAPLEVFTSFSEDNLADLHMVQSGDIITIVHPNFPPSELKRHSNTNWTFAAIQFGPDILPPTSVVTADLFSIVPPSLGTSADGSVVYAVTGVSASGQESLATTSNASTHKPIATFPQQVTATATGALTFNVYRRDSAAGVYGFIGSGIGSAVDFLDPGLIADPTLQPPISKAPFNQDGDYPAVVAYYQQRLLFANTGNNPDTVWASRTGQFHNFNTSAIVQDDDPITFRLVSDEVDAVRHILNLGRLIICTEGAEWLVEGDGNGVLTPLAVNARAGSYNGLSPLKPAKADNRIVFVQALGAAIRELQANVQFGTYSLQGTDLTLYSTHLFDGFTIVEWAWQQTPLHVLWLVRSDGVLLGCTYVPEQDVLAWHRHDTKGFVESVCVIPEGSSHWLYAIVRRFINGSYRRYIERMATTNVTPVFATPEAASQGGIFTPPPPPGAPPPSTTPVVGPSSASTTDIGTIGATANWIPGNALAPTRVEIRQQTNPESEWIVTTVAGGVQSYVFTGLTPSTNYEWRIAHVLAGAISAYLGPTAATTFRTNDPTNALAMPSSPPVVVNTLASSGFTDITISWPSPLRMTETSRLQIAGPSTDIPSEAAYADIGVFAVGVTTAVTRIVQSGLYWLRVRYEQDFFDPSVYTEPVPTNVGVVDQV